MVRLALASVMALTWSGTSACGVPAEESAPVASARALPAPDLGSTTLADVLADRRSVRAFADEPLTRAQIATVLWAAQGQTSDVGQRTAPSAGGLYPLEVYLATDVEVWHYLSDGHRAEVSTDAGAKSAVAAAVGQSAAATAPALVVIAGVEGRLAGKYGDRAERYTLLEAGHATQNLLLAATALGLGAVPIGAFDADAVRAALGLPDEQQPIYVVPVGVPDRR